MDDLCELDQTHELPVPEAKADLIKFVDDAVQANLPEGAEVERIIPHGESLWGRTAKVEARHADGRKLSYFLKVHIGAHSHGLMASEYHAMTIIHETMPELAIKPLAYGGYISNPNAYFFLAEFRDMREEMPDVEEFCEQIALLHKQAVNPEGKFGWPWPVYAGSKPRTYPLSDSWEETFSAGLRATFDIEEQVQGPDEELSGLRAVLFDKLIPCLLRPLQSEGRSIQPTLVHGDLWHGNIAIDVRTGSPIIFDPCSLWAHHEFDLGPWACPRHRIGEQYIYEYRRKHRKASEPEEDFEDRMLLYSINFDIQSSSNYPENLTRRELVKDTIRKLISRRGLQEETKTHSDKAQPPMTKQGIWETTHQSTANLAQEKQPTAPRVNVKFLN
ncbi:hypothetical protein MAPG_05076 [Magnaporthiopsis poae ATCC 64411]|uniref:protein-ribulosamine 3-kinase n=1 Tax=Magnaporthiopsis poae (strain ATCC 64411 / 73-15) TaxID=644358 RepID=A0A0C4DYF5_MAGP6|nr:hypothetical protein MAPG_05076 [Magnaporthiopsis poae ATCC 64411]